MGGRVLEGKHMRRFVEFVKEVAWQPTQTGEDRVKERETHTDTYVDTHRNRHTDADTETWTQTQMQM